MKKLKCMLCTALCLVMVMLSGCSSAASSEYKKYSYSFFDTFDTLITVAAYAPDQETFDAAAQRVHALYIQMHQLYDAYNAYDGLNNLYVLNQSAGDHPIVVDPLLYDLIRFCKEQQPSLHDKVNIAMGSVLQIWHTYREEGLNDPENAQIPPMETLMQAAEHIDFDAVVLDDASRSVYFSDPLLQLDLGAVAKGYATEVVAQELFHSGLTSFVISAGGNVRAGHAPQDGRKAWGVGIQNPEGSVLSAAADDLIEVLYLADLSVVTSGNYQRYYTVDGIRYHHLIDPATLMPAQYFPSVTIVTKDSGMADLLSTAVFLMPYEAGLDFVNQLDGVEALWVFHDGTVAMTDGLKQFARSCGATAR